MKQLTYVAASNYRPANNQEEAVAVAVWDKATRRWFEGKENAYVSVKHFRTVANREMESARVFRIGF
jgi:hypothetical protein